MQDVDRELKRVCEDLIADCSASATAPLRAFLELCTIFLASRAGRDLSAQEWATTEKVMAVQDEFKSTAVETVEAWRKLLMLYLQDEETVQVLLPPLQVRLYPLIRAALICVYVVQHCQYLSAIP